MCIRWAAVAEASGSGKGDDAGGSGNRQIDDGDSNGTRNSSDDDSYSDGNVDDSGEQGEGNCSDGSDVDSAETSTDRPADRMRTTDGHCDSSDSRQFEGGDRDGDIGDSGVGSASGYVAARAGSADAPAAGHSRPTHSCADSHHTYSRDDRDSDTSGDCAACDPGGDLCASTCETHAAEHVEDTVV